MITVFVFKRKVGARPVLGIVLALLGGVLVAGLDYHQLSSGNFAGDVLAFLAAILWGLYFTIGNEVRKTFREVPTFFWFFACWICFTIGVIATDTPILGYSAKRLFLHYRVDAGL